MENGPFEVVSPIKNGDTSIAMLVYQRVNQHQPNINDTSQPTYRATFHLTS